MTQPWAQAMCHVISWFLSTTHKLNCESVIDTLCANGMRYWSREYPRVVRCCDRTFCGVAEKSSGQMPPRGYWVLGGSSRTEANDGRISHLFMYGAANRPRRTTSFPRICRFGDTMVAPSLLPRRTKNVRAETQQASPWPKFKLCTTALNHIVDGHPSTTQIIPSAPFPVENQINK